MKYRSHAAVLAAAVAAAAPVALAQTADTSPTFSTFSETGPSSNRVDIVFIGDGYTASEGAAYDGHVSETVDYMFNNRLNDPFMRYANFFNVHQVRVESKQSGADDPNADEGNGIFVDTALNASYNTGGTDRCLYFDTGEANAATNAALSGTGIDVDMRLGVVNSVKYGGCGGQWGVWAGGNAAGKDIAIHELGHSFGRLQDEYTYGGPDEYTGGERGFFVNVSTTPEIKWGEWYGYDDPYHNGTNGTIDMSVVGAYEGGYYSETGIFRPTDDSMMRSLGDPLNAVSREQVIFKIYDEVDPLDAFLDNGETLINPEMLWVDRVDDDVIDLDWFVDGQLVVDNDDDSELLLSDLNLAPGDYEISAVAQDSVLELAFTGQDFDWVRRNFDRLGQSVSWSITVVPEPGMMALALFAPALLRRRR